MSVTGSSLLGFEASMMLIVAGRFESGALAHGTAIRRDDPFSTIEQRPASSPTTTEESSLPVAVLKEIRDPLVVEVTNPKCPVPEKSGSVCSSRIVSERSDRLRVTSSRVWVPLPWTIIEQAIMAPVTTAKNFRFSFNLGRPFYVSNQLLQEHNDLNAFQTADQS